MRDDCERTSGNKAELDLDLLNILESGGMDPQWHHRSAARIACGCDGRESHVRPPAKAKKAPADAARKP